jgi:hypothetical protein
MRPTLAAEEMLLRTRFPEGVGAIDSPSLASAGRLTADSRAILRPVMHFDGRMDEALNIFVMRHDFGTYYYAFLRSDNVMITNEKKREKNGDDRRFNSSIILCQDKLLLAQAAKPTD